jgi:hypothetical protein
MPPRLPATVPGIGKQGPTIPGALPPCQRLDERPDGSLVLALRVNHLLEVKRRVLSYGAACRVLEP